MKWRSFESASLTAVLWGHSVISIPQDDSAFTAEGEICTFGVAQRTNWMPLGVREETWRYVLALKGLTVILML